MRLGTMFGPSSGVVAAALAGAVLLIAAAVGFTVLSRDEDGASETGSDATAPFVDLDGPGPMIAPSVESAADGAVDSAALPDTGPADASALAAPDLPQLDLVRVAPDGATIIAGQTLPGQSVAILLDGTEDRKSVV